MGSIITGEYFNKDSDVYKKYKEDSLIKSVGFLFDRDEDYIQKMIEFVENRYSTLICIFVSPDGITEKACVECLLNPKVHEQQATSLESNKQSTVPKHNAEEVVHEDL